MLIVVSSYSGKPNPKVVTGIQERIQTVTSEDPKLKQM